MIKNNELDDNSSDYQPFKHFSETRSKVVHRYYISDHIDNSYQWYELFDTLRDAKPDDTFMFYLACRGGLVDVGLQLVNAIQDSKATTMSIIDGHCYSMGSVIALSTNMMVWRKPWTLMFHNYSGGQVGKGRELLDGVTEYDKSFVELAKLICQPFLTDEEIKTIQHDKDVYIRLGTDKKTIARCKRHFKTYESIYKSGHEMVVEF